MYKLLTAEEKKKVAHDYSQHRAVVMLFSLLLVIIVAIVGLFPSYLLSSSRLKEIKDLIAVREGTVMADDETALQTWLTHFNLKLFTLYPRVESDKPSVVMEQVIAKKNPGVKLTSFNWGKKEGKVSLLVVGKADNRQALISFQNQLNASGNFSEVSVPVSNLAQDKDISFQMNLSLAQKHE